MKGILAFAFAAATCAALLRQPAKNLRRKLALVTGGSRGLGLQLARDLGAEGCRVVICARDAEDLSRAVEDLRERNIDAHMIPCDVRDEASVQRMISEIESSLGPIDILVNNAGVMQVGPMESMERADFENAMDVMLWGTVHCTLPALRSMKQRGTGTIVNIASIGGRVGIPHMVPYSTAKFATVGFSESLGTEVKKNGVTVLTVIPGLMRTGSHLNASFKGDAAGEFGWFSLGASLPLLSLPVSCASRRIVSAIKRGSHHVTVGLPALVLSRLHGLAPSVTGAALAQVNQLLPKGQQRGAIRGTDARHLLRSRTHEFFTKLGDEAAVETNQFG